MPNMAYDASIDTDPDPDAAVVNVVDFLVNTAPANSCSANPIYNTCEDVLI